MGKVVLSVWVVSLLTLVTVPVLADDQLSVLKESSREVPHAAARNIDAVLAANTKLSRQKRIALLILKAEVSLAIDDTNAAFNALESLNTLGTLSAENQLRKDLLRARGHRFLGQIDKFRDITKQVSLQKPQTGDQVLNLQVRLDQLRLHLLEGNQTEVAQHSQVLARYMTLLPDKAVYALVLSDFALLLSQQGHFEDALDLLERVIDIQNAKQNLHGLHLAHYHKGFILQRAGREEDALQALAKAAEYADRLGTNVDSAFARLKMAEIAEDLGQAGPAITWARQANDLVKAHNITRLKVKSWEVLASLLAAEEPGTSISLLEKAFAFAKTKDMGSAQQRIAVTLADSYYHQGRLEDAYHVLRGQMSGTDFPAPPATKLTAASAP